MHSRQYHPHHRRRGRARGTIPYKRCPVPCLRSRSRAARPERIRTQGDDEYVDRASEQVVRYSSGYPGRHVPGIGDDLELRTGGLQSVS